MKAYLAQLVANEPQAHMRLNLMREYLQARILSSLQSSGAMLSLAFQGGTALRFLHAIPRFSEDLDFALEVPEKGYDLRSWLLRARRDLEAENYTVQLKIADRRTVHSAFIKFPSLLHEIDHEQHPRKVLSIKVEVYTSPPEGATWTTSAIRRHVSLHLQHHDQASLLAGKLHALLQRPYLKGRDLYDLFWYLSQKSWPAPNLTLLSNALAQTAWQGPTVNAQNWRKLVFAALKNENLAAASKDVAPFLMHSREATLFTLPTLKELLRL